MIQDVFVGVNTYQDEDYQPAPGPLRRYIFSKFTSATYSFTPESSSSASASAQASITAAATTKAASSARPPMMRATTAPAGNVTRAVLGAKGSAPSSVASSRAQSPTGLSREV